MQYTLQALCRAVVAGSVAFLACTSIACGQNAFAEPHTAFETSVLGLGATPDRYSVEYVMLPMRDGLRLETVVVRPKSPGPHPTVMVRTPYSANRDFNGLVSVYGELLKRGDYVLVFQNERGTGWSEGYFHLLQNVANDGYDTLSWIAAQPWSNGRVGTSGCSSGGENQLRLGTLEHPAHKAMVAMSPGTATRGLPGIPTPGGFQKNGVPIFSAWATWFQISGSYGPRPKLPTGLTPEEEIAVLRNYMPVQALREPGEKAMLESLKMLPSRDVLRRLGLPPNDMNRIMDINPGDPHDPAWEHLDGLGPDDKGSTPNLLINGWGDVAAYETTRIYEFLQGRPDQYLIMAPTGHCQMWKATENTLLGERPVGDGRLGLDKMIVSWFDWRLKGDAVWKPMPKVHSFLMGANVWLTGDRWPLPHVRTNRLYFAGEGRANTAAGDGLLVPKDPRTEVVDQFASDPLNPVGGGGDGVFGPTSSDQRVIEARPDVLVYSTAVLNKGLAIVGDLKAVLFISTDVPDTDVAVKLVDVYPDGKAYNVTHSILRLRYRNGMNAPELMKAGQVYRVEIGGMATSNYFAPGHRLRLEVAGTNFPYFERNLNTGGNNSAETRSAIANIQIHHGAQRASFLEFGEYQGPIPKQTH